MQPGKITDQLGSLGRLMIALSLALPFLLLIGIAKRSYFVIAIPLLLMVTIVSGVSLWAGCTMANPVSDESDSRES